LSSENPLRWRVLVTGSAGFVGFHVARRLLETGHGVIGLDAFTPCYDVELKRARSVILEGMSGFVPHEFILEDERRLTDLVADARPDIIIHLAAQAGVRHSLEEPRAFIGSNVLGTFNLLEACRVAPPQHLLIASTSSVYGDGHIPFIETSESSLPLSPYAATKKATEVIAHSYAHVYGLPITAFRFFTVYGPWGRPDMALFKFTAALLEDREIEVFGDGQMSRDFTYIDDLVSAVVRLISVPPSLPADGGGGASPVAPFRVVNIGAGQPVELERFIDAIEDALGRKARRKYLPMQAGEARRTYADNAELRKLVAWGPPTPLAEGVRGFIDWYRSRYASR